MGDRLHWIDAIPGYHYYDTPEGEDCLKKVVFMSKVGIYFGVSYSTIDVLGHSQPRGIAAIAARYAMLTFPIMAVTSTFAAATCISTNIRDKDDKINYTIGGFAAGCVAGAAAKSGTFGTLCAVCFAAVATVKKYMVESGVKGFRDNNDPTPYGFGGPWSIKWDFSITEERPRGWKTSED